MAEYNEANYSTNTCELYCYIEEINIHSIDTKKTYNNVERKIQRVKIDFRYENHQKKH